MTGNFNLACGVYRRAADNADAPAVVYRDSVLSYGALAARASRLAAIPFRDVVNGNVRFGDLQGRVVILGVTAADGTTQWPLCPDHSAASGR